MGKYIIIGLLILFGVVYYFDKQHDNKIVALEQSSTLEINKNKPRKRSFWDSITRAIKNKNRPDDGIRRVGSNKPDSDTSACVGITKSDKDMIITKFAGYVLEYPCTVNQSGEYRIEYNQDGEKISQRFRLEISIKLGQESGSFWWDGKTLNQEGVQGFRVQVESNGNDVSFKHVLDRIKKAKKIKTDDKKNIIVYEEKGSVIATLKKDTKFDGFSPIITCDRNGKIDPYELFSQFHEIKWKKSECSIFWKLTKDIKVWVQWFSPKYAYHFQYIYEQINQALQEMIIKRPKTKLA